MDLPRLQGEHVCLRRWEADEAEWYVTVRDDAVFGFTSESPDLTVDEVRDAILRSYESPTHAAFAIEDDAGSLVGNLGLEFSDGVAEISGFLSPPARGRGTATETVSHPPGSRSL